MGKDKHVFHGTGFTVEEVKWGQKRFNDYLTSFPYLSNTFGSLQSLEEVVWIEVIQERYKKQIGALAKEGGSSDAEAASIPSSLQKSIQDGLNMIMALKVQLGMFEAQKAPEGPDMYEALNDKMDLYRKTHLSEFKLTCPFCADMFLMVKKMEEYDDKVMPYFENKLLNNRPLFRVYKQGRITKEEVAEVLGLKPQYVEFLEKKVYGLGTLPDDDQNPKLE